MSTETTKPALPEPDYLGNDHGQAWSRDVIAQWHERNKQHFTKPLYGVATLQSAIAASVAEAREAARTWENEAERRSRRYEECAVQLAEARAVPEAALRYLRDTAQTGTPNEQAVARTVMHLLAATPSPAEQPAGTWRSHDSRDGMRYPEASDLTGGATDVPAEQPKLAVLEALGRLFPMIERAMKDYVFTAEKAGEVIADMNTLRAALQGEHRDRP